MSAASIRASVTRQAVNPEPPVSNLVTGGNEPARTGNHAGLKAINPVPTGSDPAETGNNSGASGNHPTSTGD